MTLALLGGFLNARKWTLERLGFAIDLRDTVIGVGLAAVVYAMSTVIQLMAAGVAPGMVEAAAKWLRVSEPLGLLFAYWYVRSGRLWPVIVAHGVIDFIGLMSLEGG